MCRHCFQSLVCAVGLVVFTHGTALAQEGSAAPVAPASPPAAVAADDGWEEIQSGVMVKVVSLTRTKHQTVKLRYKLKNSSTATVATRDLPGAGSYDMSNIFLRNVSSRIEFKPLYSAASGSFTSGHADIRPNTEYIGFAEYPAPPAGVTDMTVAFGQFTIDDIPLR